MTLATRDILYIIKAKDEASRVFQTLKKNIQTLPKEVKTLSDQLKPIANDLKFIGTAFTGIAISGGLAIAALGSSAGGLQQTTRAYEALTGSAETAQELLFELADFAKKTPFTLPGVRTSGKRLLAMGFSAEEIIPTLKDVGDVAAAVGLDDEGFQRVIWNLGQVQAKGKLTGVEIRDFANNAIPIVDQLAETLGKSKDEIYKLSEGGQISAEIVMQAFNDMASEGGRFADFMSKNAGTLPQVWSNVGDSLDILREKLGKPLIGPLTQLGELIIKIANSVGDFVEKNPEVAEFAAKMLLVGTAVLAVVGPMLAIIGFIPAVVAGFSAIAAGAGIMWVAITGPIGLVVAAIAAVVAAVLYFKDEWFAMFAAVAEFTKEVWKAITQFFGEAWKVISEVFKNGTAMVLESWEVFASTLKQLILTPIDEIRESFSGLFTWIQDKLSGFLSFASNVAQGIRDLFSNSNQKVQVSGSLSERFHQIEAQASRAVGGRTWEPYTLVGENGPEVIAAPRGSRVYTNQDSKRMFGGVNVQLHVSGSLIGLDADDVVDRLGGKIMQMLNPMINQV